MIKYFYLFFMVFVLTSLNANDEINQKPFEQLIVGYNHGFRKAMIKGKFEHLRPYLTSQIYDKTFIWIDSYQASNLFMDSVPPAIKFDEIQMKQYSASMVTNEKWKYRYINIKSKQILVPPTMAEYKIKYFFVRLEDGSWKINHIKILDEKHEEIKK